MVNDVIEIDIIELNIQFEGLGFYNSKKVCVRNVLPGERVRVLVTMEKPNFIYGKLVEVIRQNPLRIEPVCKYYNNCGGCSLQILTPKEGLKMKGDVIKKYFSPFFSGKLNIYFSDNSFNYRNKIVFAVENNVIGLREENSKKLIEVDYCNIASKRINEVLQVLKTWIKLENKNLKIRYFVLREFNNKFILTIICGEIVEHKKFDNLISILQSNFQDDFGVFINYNLNYKNKEIFGNKWHHVFGLKGLKVDVNQLDVNIHPYSFLQVNNSVMQKLYARALDFISQNDYVIEGYSGAGILSCLIAKKAKEVYSIEVNNYATKDANLLKEQQKISNLVNINGDVSKEIPKINENFNNAIFLIDPPQSGCEQRVLDSIINNEIKKVIYISCNPYTLKQNIYYLKNDYRVTNLEIFDMFPNTSHIETLCVLEKIN